MSHDRHERWLAAASAAILGTLFLVLLYRAATLSFSADEGFSYTLYVGSDVFSLVRNYDANLHIIHTFLTWASVRLFGLSELTMRLPSLLGCAIYFTAVFQFGRHFFPKSPWRLIATCILTLNPLVLDHMVVSRGYGLALAFYAWAFYVAIRAVEAQSSGKHASYVPVSVLLAVSIGTNLVFLFPSAGLLAALSIADLRMQGPSAPKLSRLLNELWGPWFVFTFLLLVIPLSGMEGDEFYFGSATLSELMRILADFSTSKDLIPDAVLWIGGVLLLGSATLVAAWLLRKDPQAQEALPLIGSATLILTALGLVRRAPTVRNPLSVLANRNLSVISDPRILARNRQAFPNCPRATGSLGVAGLGRRRHRDRNPHGRLHPFGSLRRVAVRHQRRAVTPKDRCRPARQRPHYCRHSRHPPDEIDALRLQGQGSP